MNLRTAEVQKFRSVEDLPMSLWGHPELQEKDRG